LQRTDYTAVFWDLGGVLVDVDKGAAREAWARLAGASLDRFEATFFAGDLKQRFDRGAIDLDGWTAAIRQRSNALLGTSDARAVWNALIRPRPAMLAWVAELASRGLATGVISNTDPLHAVLIQSFPPLDRVVNSWTLSFEVGCLKPDPEIYRAALGSLGIPAQRALFVDDRLENVAAARALGFDALHFSGMSSLAAQLAERGLAPMPVT
jgi:putative hydrolase of the HAD superfamily